MAHLTTARTALAECQRHLEESSAFGSPIEAYLTQHLLILLFNEVEQAVGRMVRQRLASGPDPAMGLFLESCMGQVVRSVKKSELVGLVAHFGEDRKATFNDGIDPASLVAYDNAHQARKTVAHRSGCTFAFSELESAMTAADEVLGAFAVAIR